MYRKRQESEDGTVCKLKLYDEDEIVFFLVCTRSYLN